MATAKSTYMIEVVGLTKRFGDFVANDNINLHVKKGQLMTLLGPSGCGKTTLLRCITGHLTPEAGRIFIDGKDVTHVPTHKRDLGMVFQTFALFPHMTARENIGFPLKVRGQFSKKQREEMVEEALEMVRLKGHGRKYPRHLSGGQQQRVGLARALVYRPKILLFDEPLSNLDAKLREEMRFEIKELQNRVGITAIYVTHDQEEALALSDRIAIMNAGKVHQVGTPEEIYEQPETAFVADFIGLTNFIPGTLQATGPHGSTISTSFGALKAFTVPDLPCGEEVLVLIRPNNVQLSRDGDRDNTWEGTIRKKIYLGDKTDYRLKIGDFELRAQVGGRAQFQTGEVVKVHLPVGKCNVIKNE